MDAEQTVLVTGGSGFLGGWCLVELLQRGYGHEPYIKVESRANGLTPTGLLGEFA